MPWIVPSHQAPALVLKAWRPRVFCGLALVLGTMAPDLEFILRFDPRWIVSHTVVAQFYFTGPAVLLLYWLATDLVIPWLLPYIPPGPPFHWEELAATRRLEGRQWLRVAASGTVGGLTHVALDGFTHGGPEGWAVSLLPILRHPVPVVPLLGVCPPLHDVLQMTLTVVLGLAALHQWAHVARNRSLWAWRGCAPGQGPQPVPQEARRRLARVLASLVAVGALLAPLVRGCGTVDQVIEIGAYGAVTFLILGIVFGAAGARLAAARRLLVPFRTPPLCGPVAAPPGTMGAALSGDS